MRILLFFWEEKIFFWIKVFLYIVEFIVFMCNFNDMIKIEKVECGVVCFEDKYMRSDEEWWFFNFVIN